MRAGCASCWSPSVRAAPSYIALQAASFGADRSRADSWRSATRTLARAKRSLPTLIADGPSPAAIAARLQHALKCLVMSVVERSRMPGGVLGRMRRIEVSAWHESAGYWLSCRVRPSVREEFRQHVGVRPHRASSVGSGNRLEHLDPSQAADKHAMRARGEDHPHYVVCGF